MTIHRRHLRRYHPHRLLPTGALAVAIAGLVIGVTACSGTTTTGAPATAPPVFSSPTTGGGGSGGTTTSTAAGAPSSSTAAPSSTAGNGQLQAKIKLAEVATFDNPTAMTPRPNSTTLYVAEQPGRLRSIHVVDGKYSVDSALPLDLHTEVVAGGERGFLGIAFSADGNTLYTYFNDKDGRIHVIKWTMNGDTVDVGSRTELLNLQHDRVNHNGGQMQVGPDGFLYIGVGDGGGGGDPDHNGQNPNTLYGKILRIDPLHPGTDGKPYAIPADNPFATGGGAPEVWLYGARNPWRFSFDTNGDLWVADVGQDEVEEIDHLPATNGRDAGRGANLGWNQMEGSRPYNGGTPPANSVLPVFEYSHDDGACSIIGGSVYRGKKVPALTGVYLYGDYCVPDIRGLLTDDGKVVDDQSLGASVDQLTTFGVDNDHEAYAFSQGDHGKMYAVTPG